MPSPQGPNIAEDFEAETGIHVDLQTLSWDDIRPKLVTALVAGTAPADVTEFDWSWTGQFSAAGWYMPLNDVIDADTLEDIGVAKIFTVDGKAAWYAPTPTTSASCSSTRSILPMLVLQTCQRR